MLRPIAAHLRTWALWSQPRRVVWYVVLLDLFAVSGAIVAALTSRNPTTQDWGRLVALALCAVVHLQVSRRHEENRRRRKPTTHIGLVTIWAFPAVLVLPLPLTLLLILITRAQRWFIVRRPLYRFTFSAAGTVLATVAADGLLRLSGDRHWIDLGWLDSLRELGILAVVALVYVAIQAIVIGGAIALSTTKLSWATVLGTKEDNELELTTVALGIITAVLLINAPAVLAVMVLVGVLGDRIADIRQLQVDVRTDSKTGLLNMRGWRDSALREFERASRGNGRFALLMVDLDHFKAINDTWGHPAGDDVLRGVGETLRGETRPADTIGRFGGEEFVLLLPGMREHEAAIAAERLRGTIAELRVTTTDKMGEPIEVADRTTSIGVAVYPTDADTLDGLIQAADAAVYEAKENGRNQVRMAPASQLAISGDQDASHGVTSDR
ncbi:diguanylate cyclase (GGDEF)-like protein [Herbihabitans rhizosphaerae]|uniref:Diguanylate cyclase (GGDEF)-like protein n=1 Tax=Herbihabitans rhizosphaerae TaxID=1872711 RepID=A0A4V2ERP5_9PSEU|nr:GGDEF domain-containing protein [Herbihabitans rhizosphaerae]RZS32669.1 diguanylate cyclase (GGDEF)-like protein [Herbihabitans rhizosphaerae]